MNTIFKLFIIINCTSTYNGYHEYKMHSIQDSTNIEVLFTTKNLAKGDTIYIPQAQIMTADNDNLSSLK